SPGARRLSWEVRRGMGMGSKEQVVCFMLICCAKGLQDAGYMFDMYYTSVLQRVIRNLWSILDVIDQMWLPVTRTWRLNKWHYGGLTALNKSEMIWPRSYNIPPPAMDLIPGQSHLPSLINSVMSSAKLYIEVLNCIQYKCLTVFRHPEVQFLNQAGQQYSRALLRTTQPSLGRWGKAEWVGCGVEVKQDTKVPDWLSEVECATMDGDAVSARGVESLMGANREPQSC
uniref:Uncharacterized protein n=1 Tax=Callorhinchus milii TaxID=7868 RepID=A0A4W3IR13_CALMI